MEYGFEKIAHFLKALIGLCLVTTGAAGTIVLAYFSIMACIRLIQLMAKHLFGFYWG